MAPKRKGAARTKKAPAASPPPKEEEIAVSEDVPAQEAPVSDEGENPANGSIDSNKDKDDDVGGEDDTEPSPKKAKAEAKAPVAKPKGAKRGRKAKAPAAAAKKAAAKKRLPSVEEKDEDEEEEEEKEAEEGSNDGEKAANVIIIESSKECNCFKVRAAKAETQLNKSFPGLEVQVNPERPRKGCFEIRDQKGNIYLSLLGMPRPFRKLKDLDFDKTMEEVVAKIK